MDWTSLLIKALAVSVIEGAIIPDTPNHAMWLIDQEKAELICDREPIDKIQIIDYDGSRWFLSNNRSYLNRDCHLKRK